jgi:hypothetical protein
VSDKYKALDEWLGGIPEPGTSILAACNLRAKTTVSINGRVVASGSAEAMRAAERLLSGRCETKPFPLELTGHWVRETPPFRQEYDLHFVPDEPVGIAACPPAETIGVNFGYPLPELPADLYPMSTKTMLEWARREPVDTVTPLHDNDEPGQ